MAINVEAELVKLNRMTVTQLRGRYAEVFGEATRSYNKEHLVKRIIWRMQALAEGGLSERARRRAMELANDADLRLGPPKAKDGGPVSGGVVTAPIRIGPDERLPMPGTLLKRQYKGQTVQVRVLSQGFEFEGETYRSLSAIAKKITGSHWNGHLFFGLAVDPRAKKESAKR